MLTLSINERYTLTFFQYIQQIIRRDVADVEAILTAPETQDEGVWKYEHLRQFSMELNGKLTIKNMGSENMYLNIAENELILLLT